MSATTRQVLLICLHLDNFSKQPEQIQKMAFLCLNNFLLYVNFRSNTIFYKCISSGIAAYWNLTLKNFRCSLYRQHDLRTYGSKITLEYCHDILSLYFQQGGSVGPRVRMSSRLLRSDDNNQAGGCRRTQPTSAICC